LLGETVQIVLDGPHDGRDGEADTLLLVQFGDGLMTPEASREPVFEAVHGRVEWRDDDGLLNAALVLDGGLHVLDVQGAESHIVCALCQYLLRLQLEDLIDC
jgi:hypothetical protein